MKMVITAYPTRQISINIMQDMNSNVLLDAALVWYKDLQSATIQFKKQFPEIDEIMLFGPISYVEHIAEDLGIIFENDNSLQISVMVNDVTE